MVPSPARWSKPPGAEQELFPRPRVVVCPDLTLCPWYSLAAAWTWLESLFIQLCAQLVLTLQDCGGASLILCVTEEATGPREGSCLAALGHGMSQDGGATAQGSWARASAGSLPTHLSVQSAHCLSIHKGAGALGE